MHGVTHIKNQDCNLYETERVETRWLCFMLKSGAAEIWIRHLWTVWRTWELRIPWQWRTRGEPSTVIATRRYTRFQTGEQSCDTNTLQARKLTLPWEKHELVRARTLHYVSARDTLCYSLCLYCKRVRIKRQTKVLLLRELLNYAITTEKFITS